MAGKRVIIIGAGFGGLNAAKSLKKAKAEILVIDKANHHLFQPLLYQVASAAISPGEIATPIRQILRKQENTSVIMANVINIDKEKCEVEVESGERFQYDYLILAPGARHSYFGKDKWEQYAPGLKTIPDAITLREKILTSFERAERIESHAEAQKYLNFVVIGGGPTGVEMAGAIAEIARHTMIKNFRHIKPEESKIYLIEGMEHILPVYPESLSLRARRDLEDLGVKVITGKLVTEINDAGVTIGEDFIESKNVIWAAGNQASPL